MNDDDTPTPSFAELGHRSTPLGELSLRRRHVFSLDSDVYEIKLGDEYLMSSLFTESEKELGRMGVEAVQSAPTGRQNSRSAGIDVVIGGLGLGYTAAAVLGYREVRSLLVVELFDAVIDWHQRGIVPLGRTVSGDPRCRIVRGDFFERATSEDGIDPDSPGRRHHAVLVDIDHTPDELLDDANADFYESAGLAKVRSHLYDGGIFGIWSDKPPDQTFVARLSGVFSSADAHPVTFENPLVGDTYTQTVYLARR